MTDAFAAVRVVGRQVLLCPSAQMLPPAYKWMRPCVAGAGIPCEHVNGENGCQESVDYSARVTSA